MNITKSQLQKLTNKIVSDLPTYLADPDVMKYNYYNNISGLGVKVMRKNGKKTIEALALIVTAGFAKMDAFIVKQEEFNQEVRDFMQGQKVFNKNQEEFNKRIENDIKDIKSCPTIARELKLIKQ